MPLNKLALIRYKTIDQCLQNRYRKWTLEDLISACSDALYEYEGIKDGVSRRTIQLDLQMMRSNKLGYNAPIVVRDRKYYTYADKNFSITRTPLTAQDLSTLNEVLEVLQQFKGFGYFRELTSMVTRLENKLYEHQHAGKSFVDFEKNDLLKGLELIDPLHLAIRHQSVLEIEYQSFKAPQSKVLVVYPYLLKEYRNRWFLLVANKKGLSIMILALDRINAFHILSKEKYQKAPINVHHYFDDAIGVSKVPTQKPIQVIFKVTKAHVPYLVTKPLHHTQEIICEEADGTTFSIRVIWNFELERELLGFGEYLHVLGPKRLAGKIYARQRAAIALFSE